MWTNLIHLSLIHLFIYELKINNSPCNFLASDLKTIFEKKTPCNFLKSDTKSKRKSNFEFILQSNLIRYRSGKRFQALKIGIPHKIHTDLGIYEWWGKLFICRKQILYHSINSHPNTNRTLQLIKKKSSCGPDRRSAPSFRTITSSSRLIDPTPSNVTLGSAVNI